MYPGTLVTGAQQENTTGPQFFANTEVVRIPASRVPLDLDLVIGTVIVEGLDPIG